MVTEPPPVEDRPALQSDRLLAGVFVVAVFLSSTLLFLVQPLVARLLLPLAGGSSALWNTAMVFFQVTLLFGYAYAHGSLGRVGTRRHPFLQAPLLLVPLLVLPLGVPDGWTLPSDVSPSLWVLGVLALVVGLPFFALATTSPTLQVWFSATDHPRAADPYFLYAAGNVGSVLALLGYPLVLEPLFSLQTQTRIWAFGYVLFVLACVAAGVMTRRRFHHNDGNDVQAELAPLATKRRLRWLFWGFVPSALMLGVTLYASTDLASFPLLWIIPLLLYLITFIIAFGKDSLTRSTRTAWFVLATSVPLAVSYLVPQRWNLWVLAGHLLWFFAAALLCHSRLADDRPPAGHLTEFYLILSLGGALGGIFASLLAPRLFATVVEYPIAIVLALLVAWPPTRQPFANRVHQGLVAGVVASVLVFIVAPQFMLFAWLAAAAFLIFAYGRRAGVIMIIGLLALAPSFLTAQEAVLLDRSFFGVYKVEDTVRRGSVTRSIISGSTSHGLEILERNGTARPTAYYFDQGPVGTVIEATEPSRVGVIGLGAGTLAAYANEGDDYTFWEIDQLVVDIARDPELFSYLRDTQADVDIIIDDGRHGVAVSDGDFDLIVVDAFGSDAIPVHLMTAEAVELYLDKLAPGGTLLVHISNRHFDLRPVVGAAGASAGTQPYLFDYEPTQRDLDQGAFRSSWVAMGRSGEPTPTWIASGDFVPLPTDGVLWTDDYSNVLSALKFD
jgi:SAM-dependent methyltransferase